MTTSTDDGVVHLVETISTEYTDYDTNLGTKTVNYNSDKTTYETDEYQENGNGFAGGSARGESPERAAGLARVGTKSSG